MKKAEVPEAADDPKAVEAAFYKTLSAANKTAPPPKAVEAFKASLERCKRAGLTPWRDVRDPLYGVEVFMLEKSVKTFGPAVPELWREQASDLRVELGYDSAPTLEKPLIKHAVICWLRLAHVEFNYSSLTSSETPLKILEFNERRLSAAQKRFTRACESLARVRRLARPNVQVNIAAEGGRQINMA